LQWRRKRGGISELTAEIEARLRSLFEKEPSPSYREVIQAIGRPAEHDTIRRWCEKLNLPNRLRRGPKTSLNPEIEAKIRNILAESPGITYDDLAKALQVPLGTAAHWVVRLGIRHPSRLQKVTPEKLARLRGLVHERPGASYKELGELLNVDAMTVLRWLKRLNITRRCKWSKLTPQVEAQLRGLLTENPNAKYHELARSMNVSRPVVEYWMIKLGLTGRNRVSPEIITRLQALLAENPSAKYGDLADALKISRTTVWRLIKRMEFPRPRCFESFTPKTEEHLRALVAQRPLATYSELAKTLNLSIWQVMRWAKRLGISRHRGRKSLGPG
jgi:transposase